MKNDLKVLCKKLNYLYQKVDDYTDNDVETKYLNQEISKTRLEILKMELDKELKELGE
tara:strand:- start:376 stop:549 length:174 start_codon:yes stop_codon:yes gene_type:complete